jgi:hypothetical protein
MKNKKLQSKLISEVADFIETRKSLQISSITKEGLPYASYAPFAIGDECLYVLLSTIAVHASNLMATAKASVLIIEDEDSADELFARIRVNYSMAAQHIGHSEAGWDEGIKRLEARHGDRITSLSKLEDFKLFKLIPEGGRFVKGFGRAYTLVEGQLAGEGLSHMRDGHKPREVA